MDTAEIRVRVCNLNHEACAPKAEYVKEAEAPVRYSQEMTENHLHGWYNKDVPIQDNTEGKVLGAYLMAAVEYERAVMLCSD